jgi:hypothetical protein
VIAAVVRVPGNHDFAVALDRDDITVGRNSQRKAIAFPGPAMLN